MKRIFTIALAFVCLVAGGQERPKIGLVLSGGGAKGLAHIGVLEAIDSAGLNIDYITGTSMGAIIAGMYASGYNGKEIRKMGETMDWMAAIMSGTTRYEDLNIDAKDTYGNSIIELPVDDGLKLKMPTGVFEPQEVILKLEEIFFPVYKTKDFSKLKIPFKCIATDLRDGGAVVLDKGDIAFATRSSMAIPGVFSATKYRNTRLVDGGVVRNFPVQDVRSMGADYVIGVNLFEGLTDPNDLTNALDVMMQVINFRDANDLVEEKSICDMVLEPDVTGFSAASFGSSATLLAIGDSIGRDFYPFFKHLADSLYRGYGVEYNKAEGIGEYAKKVKIESFSIEGLKHTDDKLLIDNMGLHRGGEYTVQQLNEAVRRAHISQYYNYIRYELNPVDEDNGVCLKLIVEELPMSFVNVGLSYNTFTGASLMFGYKRKNLFTRRALTEVKLAISGALRAQAYHKMYFGDDFNRYAKLQYDISMYDISIYGKRKKEAQYGYKHSDISASLCHVTTKNSDWLVRAGYESFMLSPDVVNDSVPYDGRVKNPYLNIRGRHYTLNRRFLPQKGRDTEFNLYIGIHPLYRLDGMKYLHGEHDNVYRATFRSTLYQALNDRATIYEGMGVAAAYGSKVFVHDTYLGGFHSFLPSHFEFAGINTASIQAPTLAMVKLGFQYNVIDKLYARLQANSAVKFLSLDKYFGKDKIEGQKFNVEQWVHGVAATVAYDFSYLPFDVTLQYSPEYKFEVLVNVGFYF
ncbi:MAG: patatin-like phospholipase family protein [Bacteroidales bacterium]|nr:patatin-like phospholipase family protein [Bacteroidales bacterium]